MTSAADPLQGLLAGTIGKLLLLPVLLFLLLMILLILTLLCFLSVRAYAECAGQEQGEAGIPQKRAETSGNYVGVHGRQFFSSCR
jgi:hypothetical protein